MSAWEGGQGFKAYLGIAKVDGVTFTKMLPLSARVISFKGESVTRVGNSMTRLGSDKTKMITIFLHGGCGNMLFEFALAKVS